MTEVSVETCFLNLKVLSFSSISSNNPLKTEVCRNVVEAAKRNGTHRKNRKLPVSTDMVRSANFSHSSFRFCRFLQITTVFLDSRLSKTKHPRKSFRNFRQSHVIDRSDRNPPITAR